MATNLDTILGSENNIQTSLFELSDIYFPNVLPDTLKTGLFGYMNEIFAHGLKQNIYHTNVVYNEYFFNTASFSATIYNKAVDYNLVFSNSKPSKATIQIALKINELDQYKDSSTHIYLLKRNKTKIMMGEFSFLLPYDVSINILESSPIPKITVEYDIINCPRINEEIELLYKNNYKVSYNVSKIDEDYYLYMILDIYQLTIEENKQSINVTRLEDQLYFDIKYTDQLVDFYTEYKYPSNSTSSIVLDKFISDYNIGSSTEYCFFNYLDESSYRIYFTKTGFSPRTNSELVTYTYTSKGVLGNFRYSGAIGIELENNLTYVVSILDPNSSLYHPRDGLDRSSLLDMKKELFKTIKKVNTLNTDNDLEEYFNTLCSNSFSANSVMKFIKIQDDIMKREYGVYLAIFDDVSTIGTNNLADSIPFSSNSVNIVFNDISEFTTDINNSIDLNTIIVYDSNTNTYRLKTNTEDELDFKYRYTSPFLIKIRYYNNGSYRLKFYNTYLDNRYDLYLKEKTTLTTDYYILNNINIYRDSYYNNTVDFKCSLDTNTILGVSDIPTRLNKIKMFVVLRKAIDNTNLGYIQLNYNGSLSTLEGKNIFNATAAGFDDIFIDDLYNLNNILKSPITGNLYNINIPEDLTLEIIIIDNDSNIVVPETIVNNLGITVTNPDRLGKFPINSVVSSKSTARELATHIFDTEDFFVSSYMLDTTKTKILFQSLNHIINSTVVEKDNKYIFDRVPLFSLETYRLNARKTLFSQQLIDYSNKVYDSIKNLCNNTSINLKFFNTYGMSKLYTTSDNITSVNNSIDISLSFIIRLNVQYSDILEKKIKDFILKYIRDNNAINNTELIKSNLVTALENEFIEIKSAVFTKINESTSLLSVKPLFEKDVINTKYIDTVPEYLHVGYNRNSNGIINTPKIEIIYK